MAASLPLLKILLALLFQGVWVWLGLSGSWDGQDIETEVGQVKDGGCQLCCSVSCVITACTAAVLIGVLRCGVCCHGLVHAVCSFALFLSRRCDVPVLLAAWFVFVTTLFNSVSLANCVSLRS